jgi:hypothetical protein
MKACCLASLFYSTLDGGWAGMDADADADADATHAKLRGVEQTGLLTNEWYGIMKRDNCHVVYLRCNRTWIRN